jgi:hypothetical protein
MCCVAECKRYRKHFQINWILKGQYVVTNTRIVLILHNFVICKRQLSGTAIPLQSKSLHIEMIYKLHYLCKPQNWYCWWKLMRWNYLVKYYDFCIICKWVFWWDNIIKVTHIAGPELTPLTISTSHQHSGCMKQNFISLWLCMHASLKNVNSLCSPADANRPIPEFYVTLHNILVAPAVMPLMGMLPVMSLLK